MKDDFSKHIIVNSEKLNKLIETKRKIKNIELDDDLFWISYHDIDEEKFSNDHTEYNISVAIASAITAYSRIHMTQFKILSENKIYYSDTDSAVMEKPLDEFVIGKN